MAIVLDRSQRDALYSFVVSDLAESGNLALALEEGEIVSARRLRQQFIQGVQLLDQIGWEKIGPSERYDLEFSAEDGLALFGRLHDRATGVITDAMSQFADEALKDAHAIAEALEEILGDKVPPALPAE